MMVDRLKHANWLNGGRARGYAWVLALVNIALLAWLVATSSGGVDRNGYLLGSDFLSFWTAGQMLHEGGNVYDVAAHASAQQSYFAQENAYVAFFYPPPFLPICYLLGFLPYFPALFIWLLTTGLGFAYVAKAWLARLLPGQFHWTWIAALPTVLITVTHGQTSFLIAGVLGAGALLVDRRPLTAGLLLGLAVIKPQLGLMVPLVLLMTRQWTVIAAAVASAAVVSALATLAFGTAIWGNWLAGFGSAGQAMENGAIGYAKMQSLYAAAKLLGAPTPLVVGMQAGLTALVALLLAWASWKQAYNPLLGAAMLAGSVLATPFILDYDLVLMAFPLIALLSCGFQPWQKLIAALAFIAPVFARPLATDFGIPVMVPILIALFIVLIRRSLAGMPGESV